MSMLALVKMRLSRLGITSILLGAMLIGILLWILVSDAATVTIAVNNSPFIMGKTAALALFLFVVWAFIFG